MFKSILAGFALALMVASVSNAASVDYDDPTNTWTFSGFQNTGVGYFASTGIGLGGNGPTTRVGNGASMAWNNSRGGWVYYNNTSEFTDYWHDTSFSYTITGAKWSNTARNNNDGMFSLPKAVPAFIESKGIHSGRFF